MNLKTVLTIVVGVIAIAAVILGSVHIYSTAVARKVLEQTLNGISIVGMAPIQRMEDPARFTYEIDINVANPARLTAEVEMLTFEVTIDDTLFEATPLNQWKATIHPSSSRDLSFTAKGQITIDEPTIVQLKDKDAVSLVVSGELKVTARQAWVTESVSHQFQLDSSVVFD